MQCNDEHNAALADYLRYLRRKRDAAIAEVAAEFVEIKEARLFDDNYAVEDVIGLLDGLLSVVRSTMKRDLQNNAFSAVLLLKQAFEQAEERGLTVATDLPAAEDRNLLAVVERWDMDVHGGSSGAAPPPLRAKAAQQVSRGNARALPVIGQAQDPKLLADLQNAKEDTATLQERFNRLQVQCSGALREKSELQAQVHSLSGGGNAADEIAALVEQNEQLRAEIEALQQENGALAAGGGGGGGGAGVDQMMEELRVAQDSNAQLMAELDAARAEATQRVERSAPFINLRQMLGKKNQLVRSMRDTLEAHGIRTDDIDAED